MDSKTCSPEFTWARAAQKFRFHDQMRLLRELLLTNQQKVKHAFSQSLVDKLICYQTYLRLGLGILHLCIVVTLSYQVIAGGLNRRFRQGKRLSQPSYQGAPLVE